MPSSAVPGRSAFQFFSGPDYVALPREPVPWLIRGLIPIGGLTNLYSKPKIGKSFMALGMSLAIANEWTAWEGFPVFKHGPVAYLQVDTPRDLWVAQYMEPMMKAGYDFSRIHFADINTVPYPVSIRNRDQADRLQDALAQIKPALTVVDTWRETFEGNENESDIQRTVIQNLRMAVGTSAILLISHQRKDGVMSQMHGADDLLMDDARGSSYLAGRMDVIIKLTEKQMVYRGRSNWKGILPTERDELGMVHVAVERLENHEAIARALISHPGMPVRKLARILLGEEPSFVGSPVYGILRMRAGESTIRGWIDEHVARGG